MPNIENFSEKKEIEKDLEKVGARVEQNKEKLESPQLEKPEEKKELVKKSVKQLTEETSLESADVQEHPVSDKVKKDDEDEYLPDYMEDDEDEEAKNIVEGLLQIAVDKGILKALRKSKKYPPFIQDAFHDGLSDKLIPELEKRGKI